MKNNTYHIFFRNLANPLKTKIILELRKKPYTVLELSKVLNVEQSKLSHALAPLRVCNIVQADQKGKNRIYVLNKDTIIPILNIINKHKLNYCKKCKKK